jgi:hypothetical protein
VQTSDRGRLPMRCTVAIMNTVLTTPQPPDTTCNTGHHKYRMGSNRGSAPPGNLPCFATIIYGWLHNLFPVHRQWLYRLRYWQRC